MQIKSNTYLHGAWYNAGYGPKTLKHYDDCLRCLWIAGNEFGITHVIRAQSFESAYEIWLDESPTIPESEIPEAYGFDSEQALKLAVDRAQATGDYPELSEGYSYQPNAVGTGIVWEGYYMWLREVDKQDFRNGLAISLVRE